MPPAKVDPDAVRRLYERGLTDAGMAEALGWDPCTVRRNRRLLGLPSRHSPRDVQSRNAGRLAAARVSRLAANRRDYAGRYGLPDDLKAVQVAVILSLVDGPATAAELADRCGRNATPGYRTAYHRFLCPKVPGSNYLTDLRRRGLISYAPIGRGAGGGSGRGAGLYLLTATCLDLLTANYEDPDHDDR